MLDHVTIRVEDREASEHFYGLVLSTLGIERTGSGEEFAEWHDFLLARVSAEHPATRRLHIGFAAPSRAHVDEFWHVGCAAGYRDDGAPGPRPQYSPDYYGSFLLDPDGNSTEAVHDVRDEPSGVIDHLWIRVASVTAAKRFYEAVGSRAGFGLAADMVDRVRFAGRGLSFSLVAGEKATENVHLAFGANDAVSLLDPDGNSVELVTRDGLRTPLS